jgi:hypothetical protein
MRRYIMLQIYNEYGVEIINKDNKFYMRYDSGEIAVHIREIEITKEEVEHTYKRLR